jgi:hypothetical protein
MNMSVSFAERHSVRSLRPSTDILRLLKVTRNVGGCVKNKKPQVARWLTCGSVIFDGVEDVRDYALLTEARASRPRHHSPARLTET